MKQNTVSKNAAAARALFSTALSLHQAGNINEAKNNYKKILKLIPAQPDALHMLGVTEFQEKRFQKAIELISCARESRSDNYLVHFNLGNALRAAGRFEEASEAYQQAVILKPDSTEAQKNLGNTFKELNLMVEAISCYDRILERDPYHYYTLYNKSIALLTLGKLDEGWELYEHRLSQNLSDAGQLGHSFPRFAPDWNGEKLEKPLLVLPEQGLGDQIFYGAMLQDLQSLGIEGFICLDGRLQHLFKRSFRNLDFILPSELSSLAPTEQLFGAQIQVASLGRVFRRRHNDLSRIQSPFLFANKELSEALSKKHKKPGTITCGLSWISSSPGSGTVKSISLADLSPLLAIKNVNFVNLQYGDTAQDCDFVKSKFGVDITKVSEIDNHFDIDELAALIAACDVVVTVSNSTAHLAAALGRPALVLLPHHTPLWYWHLDSNRSPWYPSVTLLRQEIAGNWEKPVKEAESLLSHLAKAIKN